MIIGGTRDETVKFYLLEAFFSQNFFSADQLILSALTEYNFELYQLENDQYQDQDQDFRRGLRSG